MKRIGVSQFRQTFITLREPVEILKGVETIGTFYPAGSEKTLYPGGTVGSNPVPPIHPAAEQRTRTIPATVVTPETIVSAAPKQSVHQILAKVNTKTK